MPASVYQPGGAHSSRLEKAGTFTQWLGETNPENKYKEMSLRPAGMQVSKYAG